MIYKEKKKRTAGEKRLFHLKIARFRDFTKFFFVSVLLELGIRPLLH